MYGEPIYGIVEEQFPIVQTEKGKVMGETRDGVAIFRSIPYGGRVDRERRFLPAEKPEAWEGVMDCTKNGPICVQTAASASGFYETGGRPDKLNLQYETQDENCLNLNILTPGIDNKKRPVLFYIHGGGYSILSGTIFTAADQFPREQDAIIVSVNHRLHMFGYLYLGDLDPKYKDSGIVGHLDLILALEWVRDNIEAFGGDPGNITIIGESGGSDKVLTLLHMPEAQGLFHKAIAISAFLGVGRVTKEVAAKNTLQVLDLLGISPDHFEKLLELPARYITNTVYAPETHMWSHTFAPVSDGIHLGDGIGAERFVPALENTVPLIVGSSEDEMANFRVEESFDITESNLREKLLERGESFGLPITEDNVDEVIEVFRKKNIKHDTAQEMFMKIVSVKCHMGGATYLAESYAEHGKRVYLYLNRYDAPNNQYPERRYAGHCMDLSPSMRMVAYPFMEEYSQKIAAAYGAFMRTGDPSTDTLPWAPYTLDNHATMIYDNVFEVLSAPLKEELEVLDKVTGHKGIVDPWAGFHHNWDVR